MNGLLIWMLYLVKASNCYRNFARRIGHHSRISPFMNQAQLKMSSIEPISITDASFELEVVIYSPDNDYKTRFNNVGKLYGSEIALQRLKESKVCIIGLGGVGSWVVEALARSGICNITLFDMDDICVSNVNRQIMATTDTIGQFKADALKNRILLINPLANVSVYYDFIRSENVLTHLTHVTNTSITRKFDFIIDAADGVSDKAAIFNTCVASSTPIVSSGGVGGLVDPTLITISDLTDVTGDNLLMRVRKKLRQEYGYPKGVQGRRIKKWNIPVVHSKPTGRRRDSPLSKDDSDSSSCSKNTESSSSFRKCDGLMGNACFATGTVGFIIASVVVNAIATNTCLTPRNPNFMSIKRQESIIREQDMINGDGNEQSCNCGSLDLSITEANTTTTTLYDGSFLASDASRPSSTMDKLAVDSMFGDRNKVALDVPIIDAHCHLQLPKIFDNYATIIDQAINIANISHMVVCGTTPLNNDWDKVAQLSSQYSNVIPNFGLHPWWIERFLQHKNELGCSWQEILERKLQECPSAGVGECGLDKNVKKDAPIELQAEILREHIRIAGKYNRSVTIHCVAGSWGTLLEVLREECCCVDNRVSPHSIILHSCNGLPVDMLSSFHAIPSLYFSVSGRVLHEKCLSLLTRLPLDQLLIETDSPDQVPLPLKQSFESNEPSLLRWTLKEVARVREMDVAELARLTAENTKRAYCIA